VAVKKSEIYSRIWQGCDVLRGGMNASQYKDYVLSILFIKSVSDKRAVMEKWYRGEVRRAAAPSTVEVGKLFGCRRETDFRSAHENQVGKLSPHDR
jgi:type I restriction-modification system DNA methylase subunit